MFSTKNDPALHIKVKQASNRLSASLNSLKLIPKLGWTQLNATTSTFIDGLHLDYTHNPEHTLLPSQLRKHKQLHPQRLT